MILDQHLSIDAHIKVTYFQVKMIIRAVKNVLSAEALERRVHAFVTACLGFCNSILAGIPDTYIPRLQLLQNAAAHLYQRHVDMSI